MEAGICYNLVLTIDETVQSILEKYLAEGVEQFNVKNYAVAYSADGRGYRSDPGHGHHTYL